MDLPPNLAHIALAVVVAALWILLALEYKARTARRRRKKEEHRMRGWLES